MRDEDRIYAVVRGVGSASDGKGKGITAPNPVGQRFAVERAWRNAGLSPAECTLVEGHGTSTSVGDAVELQQLDGGASPGRSSPPGSIALGSVKSNIGHLKAAAGAAGMLKATLALHDKVLPPSINFERPNPNLDWTASPFAVNTELRDWDVAADRSRVAGVSAFGFGGTNFHLVMEEYVPGRSRHQRPRLARSPCRSSRPARAGRACRRRRRRPSRRCAARSCSARPTRRGSPTRCGPSWRRRGRAATSIRRRRATEALRAPERIAIDYADGPDLVAKAELALRVVARRATPRRGRRCAAAASTAAAAAPGKVAFLYTGQGSQYANMLAELRRREPVVAELFEEADAIMAPLLEGRAPVRHHLRRPGRPGRRWRGRRRSFAAPRSSSRR